MMDQGRVPPFEIAGLDVLVRPPALYGVTAHHHVPGPAALALGYREALVFAAGLATAAFFVSVAFIPADQAHPPSKRLPLSRFAALQRLPRFGGARGQKD